MLHEGRSERIGQEHIEMILIESMCNFFFFLVLEFGSLWFL